MRKTAQTVNIIKPDISNKKYLKGTVIIINLFKIFNLNKLETLGFKKILVFFYKEKKKIKQKLRVEETLRFNNRFISSSPND